MANHRIDRITEDVKRELTAIFRELKDPRVNSCFLSIVRVEVTNDLSYCTVYVSALLRLRHVPELIFTPTDSIEYSAEISRILNSLDIPKDEEEPDETDNAQ